MYTIETLTLIEKEMVNTILEWFDNKIGTEREVEHHGEGMYSIVFFEMLASEASELELYLETMNIENFILGDIEPTLNALGFEMSELETNKKLAKAVKLATRLATRGR